MTLTAEMWVSPLTRFKMSETFPFVLFLASRFTATIYRMLLGCS